MNCRVTIDRGSGEVQIFDGTVIDETDTHVRVKAPDVLVDEWFARDSKHVRVSLYGKQKIKSV